MTTKTLDNISEEIDQLYAMTEREFVALAKRMKKIEEELAQIKLGQKQTPMRRPQSRGRGINTRSGHHPLLTSTHRTPYMESRWKC